MGSLSLILLPHPPRRSGICIFKDEMNVGFLMATIAMIQNGNRQAKPALLTEARLQCAIERIAESDCPLLILGEHGTGKRSIAAQIHARSNLSRSAFLEIRCMDATAALLRSALSTEGTLYLIEIAELSLPMQELIVNTYFRS